MAIVGTGTPTNMSNIQLPNEVSQEILQKVFSLVPQALSA